MSGIAEFQDGTRVGPFAALQSNFLTVLESNRDSSKQLKREKELSIRVQELFPEASKYLNRGRRLIMSYRELTVWTRGIIMDKEGRDIVNSIAAAAMREGKYSQAMENYVDNPDRTNAPTRKYCRVSDGVIENALTYENEQPNIVVLIEETMVKGWDYLRGMPPGGTLVINTHYSPEYMIRFVPGSERLAQLVCVDAAHLADHKWLYYRLGELGLDRLSTEGAAERNKSMAPDIAAPLIAAVVKTTGIVKLETIEPMITNKRVFEMALDRLHILPLKPVAA
jgi:Pyruvate/2-oxoacid:ferredoxin oxidoreductase gamma subunit